MSDSNPTPKPPAAVRLARVARPDMIWKQSNEDYCAYSDDDGKEFTEHFGTDDLNDLALVERRVCAAGYRDGHEGYINTLCGVCDDGCPVTATAPQRAAALLAFLDAHPAVEERLAAGE